MAMGPISERTHFEAMKEAFCHASIVVIFLDPKL